MEKVGQTTKEKQYCMANCTVKAVHYSSIGTHANLSPILLAAGLHANLAISHY